MKILNVICRKLMADPKLAPEEDWMWELLDSDDNLYYIMDSPFYKLHGIRSPVQKGHLDSLSEGYYVNAEVSNIDKKSVVTKILD